MPAQTIGHPRRMPIEPPMPIDPKSVLIEARRHRYAAVEHALATAMERKAAPMTETAAYEHLARPGGMQAKRDLARRGAPEPKHEEDARDRAPSTPFPLIASGHAPTITTLLAPPKP